MLSRMFKGRERGQILILSMLIIPILLGMTGMAVDIGGYASHRRDLQNAADAMALAAVQELPEHQDQAQAAIDDWAAKNNIDAADIISVQWLEPTGDPPKPTKVRVTLRQEHDFKFVRAVGIKSSTLDAKAAASKVSFGGGYGLTPWAVLESAVDDAQDGDPTSLTMKFDADGVMIGNFGSIQIDGDGGNVYRDSIKWGSDTIACAESAPDCSTSTCPGTFPDECSETSPECDGSQCQTEPGNIISTKQAVDFIMNHTSEECDTFDEAFGTADADGKYDLAYECNPWTTGPGQCSQPQDPDFDAEQFCSRRVIIIPVIDAWGNGASDPITILRFALFYLEGYENGKCTGSECNILGRFVTSDVHANALAGVYDAKASIHFSKLTE